MEYTYPKEGSIIKREYDDGEYLILKILKYTDTRWRDGFLIKVATIKYLGNDGKGFHAWKIGVIDKGWYIIPNEKIDYKRVLLTPEEYMVEML